MNSDLLFFKNEGPARKGKIDIEKSSKNLQTQRQQDATKRNSALPLGYGKNEKEAKKITMNLIRFSFF